ncbi:MAG: DUF58 domain-containing protein, partial [Halodesulfurarchaeum sp.]
EAPTVRRSMGRGGHQGADFAVSLWVESERNYPARITDRTGSGLVGDTEHRVIADGRRLHHEVTLKERGHWPIGPVTIVAYDPFGLWERTFTAGETETIIVYPRVDRLASTPDAIAEFSGSLDDREHFDGVREYRPGDPLQDVNWKSTARRPDGIIVTEYAGGPTRGAVTIAVESSGSNADRVATAAATVATALLDAGLTVGLSSRNGHIDPSRESGHRRRLLEHLAGVGVGPVDVDVRDDADVVISSSRNDGRVEVLLDDEWVPYVRLAGNRSVVRGIPRTKHDDGGRRERTTIEGE